MTNEDTPIRILHVMGAMEYGGIQTWLMHMLRNIDRDRFKMDFLVHTQEEHPHDAEIRSLNSRVIPCPEPHNPLVFARNFKRALDMYGPYDVVHSHVHHFSGIPLFLANRFGVTRRIAHSHNDKTEDYADSGRMRNAYLKTMRASIRQNATLQLAISKRAAHSLYGPGWRDDPRVELLYYGIELGPFEEVREPEAVRAELGLPRESPIIGHVGSFSEQKNHPFLIEIIDELAERGEDFHAIFVGDGPLRGDIERDIAKRGLSDRITLLGLRSDVPELMSSAMDLFLFPSHYEGLGLVLLEAQAGGTSCIFTDIIPEEADVVPELMTRLSLTQTVGEWADVVAGKLREQSPVSRKAALATLQDSRFNLQRSVNGLEEIYNRGTP